MIKHSSVKTAALKTAQKSTRIIGGESDYCADSFGYTQSDEGLQASYTPVVFAPFLNVPNVRAAQYLPNLDYAFIIDDEGNHYRWNPVNYRVPVKRGKLTSERTFAFGCYHNRADAYAVFSGKTCFVLEGDGTATTTNDQVFHCGDWHKGRGFLRAETDKFKVYWTGRRVSNLKNDGTVNGSGYVCINPKGGGVLNIIEYGERLFLVRESAISEMVAPGDPRHFRVVTNTRWSLPQVCPDTAVICAGKLWLCTAEGIYGFDGSSVTCERADWGGKTYTIEGAAAYAERYICYNAVCGGEKMLLEFDTVKKTLTPFAKKYDCVFWMKQGLYAFYDDIGCHMEKGKEDPDRVWTSKGITLGTDAVKTLKYLTAEGNGNAQITVNCGGVERTVSGFGNLPVNLRGKSFTVTVKGACNLTNLTAHWEVNDGV
ncbi:MAG: hypothetical protein K2O67_04490 [Clostridia bacterium]|nr:hypothetical protein [Clostridia bacterium]